MSYSMVVKLFNSFAYLMNYLKGVFLVHLIILAVIESVPELKWGYQRDPPSQYSVMYQMHVSL